MIDNLSEDEVIIVNSHDDIFKDSQIQYWRKDRISDILPAIKCSSFKSEIENFKTFQINTKIKFLIRYQNHTKSIIIENARDKLSFNLVYGDSIKIRPNTFYYPDLHAKFYNKLQERYELWKIDDCACKPKKIRVWEDDFEKLKYTIEKIERFSSTNDVKLGFEITDKDYERFISNYDTIVFNYSTRLMSDKETKFIFTGETLTAVSDGNYYSFRLDQRTMESEDSHIKGKI